MSECIGEGVKNGKDERITTADNAFSHVYVR